MYLNEACYSYQFCEIFSNEVKLHFGLASYGEVAPFFRQSNSLITLILEIVSFILVLSEPFLVG